MHTVLFSQPKTDYHRFGFNCFGIERNALNYHGLSPVVAHPPCRTWGRMRGLSTAGVFESVLAVWAFCVVRSVGGILEHPYPSELFKRFLPSPGQTDQFGGFTILINQHWFGHPAQKKTTLYICGMRKSQLPPIPYSLDCPQYTISSCRPKSKNTVIKPEVSLHWRSRTPDDLIIWITDCLNIIASNRQLILDH